MDKKFTFVIWALMTITLSACDNDSPSENKKDSLPRIQSFVWDGTQSSYPEQLNGLNSFSYDSDGRIKSYATPSQKTTYTYDGLNCVGVMTSIPDNEKLQDQYILFNKDGHPVSEESTSWYNNSTASMKYGYDSEGRIISYDFYADEKRNIYAEFRYDSSTGLMSEAIGDYQIGSGKRVKLKYSYYYSDRPNPVAFYPEFHQIFDAEPALAFTGIDGYGRDRLIDRIVVSVEGTDAPPIEAFLFSYEFSAGGKLTSITETLALLDDDGNVMATHPLVKITDIRY